MVIRGVGSADRLAEGTRRRDWQTPRRLLKPTPRGQRLVNGGGRRLHLRKLVVGDVDHPEVLK